MSSIADKARAMLWGIFIGDALSMPVHWYYNTDVLKHEFGYIKDYQAPKKYHPTSIMNVANTGKGGRGGQEGSIIGDVILHDKKKFWGKKGVHYHQGMEPGENTLNSLCARVLMRTLVRIQREKPADQQNQPPFYDADAFLQDYAQFMTTPGTHNDTYAESYHRDFFSNYAQGKPLRECAGKEGHDTPSIGGFVSLPIVVLAAWAESAARNGGTAQWGAEEEGRVLLHLGLTHRSALLEGCAKVYARLLWAALEAPPDQDGRALRESLAIPLQNFRVPLDFSRPAEEVVGGMFSIACYIDQSLPSLMYLAGKYATDFEGAVTANTNCGGENCHRGSALGALMGASLGMSKIPPRFIEGLKERQAIEQEIEDLLSALHIV